MFFELFVTFSTIVVVFSIILFFIKEFTELSVLADKYHVAQRKYVDSCLAETNTHQEIINIYRKLTQLYHLSRNYSIDAMYQRVDQQELIVYKIEEDYELR